MYKRKTSTFLAVFLLMALTVKAQMSGTYSVDPTGAGDFKTLNELQSNLSSKGVSGPVTVNVEPGTYSERVTFKSISGLSATNTLLIQGDDPSTTLIEFTATSSGDRSVVRIENLSYVTLKDISVKNNGTSYGWGIHVYSSGTQVEYVNLENCQVEVRATSSSNFAGILYNGSTTSFSSSGRPIRNSTIEGCGTTGGYVGIMFTSNRNSSGATGNRILNSKVTNYYFYGIYLNSLYGFELDGCSVVGGSNTRTSAVGLQYFNNSSSGTHVIKLNNNYFEYPGRNAIYLSSAQGGNSTSSMSQRGQMFNNMIIMDGSYSDTRGIYTTSTYSGYFDIWHNSVVINNSNSKNSSACIYYQGNYCSIKYNNLGYMASSGSALPLYIQIPPLGLVVDNNNYYNNASPILCQIVGAYTANNFLGGGGYNTNSYNVDPNFISSKDLHLKGNKAFPFTSANAVTADFDGDKRCSFASSIGADQSAYIPSFIPAFKSPDTAIVNSPATFLNQNDKAEPMEYTWSINGKPQGTSRNFTFTFTSVGTYDVNLKASNCSGKSSDSTFKVIVVAPSKKPVADFAFNKTLVEVNEQVSIQDLSSNGPSWWEYEIKPSMYYNSFTQQYESTFLYDEGDTTEPSGKLVFRTPGKYEVCLAVENAVGKDATCKKEIIEVIHSENMCGFFNSSTENKGVLYDAGGKGAYGASQSCNYLIASCAGDVIIDFEELNLAQGDYLRVYDGANSSGKPLWDNINYASGLTGDLTGMHITMKALSGTAYLEFESDNSTTTLASGFKAVWSVDAKSFSPPSASFSNPDTICVDASVVFKNESTGSNNTYKWFVNGKEESSNTEFFEETFLFDGTYEIKLYAINCGGIDSMLKTVRVVKQAKTARPSFTANNTTPNLGETIQLWDMTTYCHEEVEWSISPSTFRFENGSSSKSSNPEVKFTAPGCYSVSLKVTNASGSATRTKKCFVNVGKYCLPATNILSTDLGIIRFSVDDIDQSSDANVSGYTSYASGTRGTLVKGATYQFELERGGNNDNFSGSIWIDLDGNGTFSASEEVASVSNSSARIWLDSFKIPVTASTVVSRMRIQTTSAIAKTKPCGPSATGEYEDYAVEIFEDNTLPEITLKGSGTITIEEGYGFTDPGYTAFDFESGNITSDVVVKGSVDDKLAGTYTLEYNVADEAGNKASTVKRTIVVVADTTRPVLGLNGNEYDTIYVGDSYADVGAQANDILDGDISGSIVLVSTLDSSKIGTYKLTYSATDSRSNTGSINRWVTVLDSTAPVLTLTGLDTVKHEVLDPYVDPGINITDNHDDLTTITVTVTESPDVEKVGIYAYTVCATDQSGNTTCITRHVDVADRTAPSIVLRGSATITHEVHTDFNDPWVTVGDNFDRNVTVTTGGDFDGTPDELGTFTIWYYAEDASGNKDSVSREITVVDTTPPVISLNGNVEEEVDRWEDFVDPGVTASDNYDVEADITITIDGDYTNSQSVGRYYITYQAEDKSGNKSVILTRIVDVIDPATGINEISGSQVELYPNPASSAFVLKAALNSTDRANLIIVDMTGRIVYEEGIADASSFNREVNVEQWETGNYLIRITTSDIQVLERLSIVR